MELLNFMENIIMVYVCIVYVKGEKGFRLFIDFLFCYKFFYVRIYG